jgi:hypothetical protein
MAEQSVTTLWRDIETAPKDGTTILVWSRYTEISTAEYRGGSFVPVCDGSRVIENQGDWGTDYKDIYPISHWHPLPEVPHAEE